MSSAAEKMVGFLLNDNWTVIEKIEKKAGSSGGNFSIGYIVEDPDGKQAFMKAIDYSIALKEKDPIRAFQYLSDAFVFERDLVMECQQRKLNRIVRAISYGQHIPNNKNALDLVPYLIFEMADGDVRCQSDISDAFELAFSLRCLHQAATGLNQLHSIDVAHQDLKPSNILLFGDQGAKLADLGSSVKKNVDAPQSLCMFSGDLGYAPPELFFGHISTNWETRRKGTDFYQLGSMVFFFFSGSSMTLAMKSVVDQQLGKLDYQNALPFLTDALNNILADLKIECSDDMSKHIKYMIKYLCEPNIELRGHPKWIDRNQFSLEPVISKLDILASYAEAGFIGIIEGQ